MVRSITDSPRYESHFNMPSDADSPSEGFTPTSNFILDGSNTHKSSSEYDIIKANNGPREVHFMEKDYVTRYELDKHGELMEQKITNVKDAMFLRFDNLDNKIDNMNQNVENTIKLSFYEREEKERKERKETTRYVIGTLIIGSLGLITSILGLLK